MASGTFQQEKFNLIKLSLMLPRENAFRKPQSEYPLKEL
jgi:hypothetical protein